jgi:hypothetical protein
MTSGTYGLKSEDVVTSSTPTPAPIDIEEERPSSPSILSEWSYPPSPEPEREVETETLAKSLTSGEYLSTLIAASENTTASTRLLRILRDENVALDTSVGLKLLDLAKALRTDGELAATPQQATKQVSVPETVPAAVPTPVSPSQCDKFHPTEKMLLHVLERLNDHSGMLNAIAEASGVNLLENDEGKDDVGDDGQRDNDGDGDDDEAGDDAVGDDPETTQAKRSRFGCSMISENDGPLDFGDDLTTRTTAATLADSTHSTSGSTEANEPRRATYPTCENAVDAPPTPTVSPKLTLANHPWYRRSAQPGLSKGPGPALQKILDQAEQLAPANDQDDSPTPTPTVSPPFRFASVLQEQGIENKIDHDHDHDHGHDHGHEGERERERERGHEPARGQGDVQGRHLYSDENGVIRCNADDIPTPEADTSFRDYFERYDSCDYRPLPQIPTRNDTTGWHGASAPSWPSPWPAMYSYGTNPYPSNYAAYAAPHATPVGHSAQGHHLYPYSPPNQPRPPYTASPAQNPSAAGWYAPHPGF